MILPLLVASFLSCAVLGDPIRDPSTYSTGKGVDASIQAHPFLASIQSNESHVCAGSVISESTILTSARCAKGYPLASLSVRVGSSDPRAGGSRHEVVGARIHENYLDNFGFQLNDVALLKVSPSLEFGGNVTNVLLPKRKDWVVPGTVASVAGWARATGRLMETSLPVIESDECARDHGDVSGKWMSMNGLICAGRPDADTCLGDSGGPLMDGLTQIGISTWGSGCLDTNYQRIYVDVALYYDWIRENSIALSLPEEPAPPASSTEPSQSDSYYFALFNGYDTFGFPY